MSRWFMDGIKEIDAFGFFWIGEGITMKTKIAIAVGSLAVLCCLGFIVWKINNPGTSSSSSETTSEVSDVNSESAENVDDMGTSAENGGVTATPI